MARHFRIEEAQRLLPEVEGILREAMSIKNFFDDAESDLRATAQRIALSGGATIDTGKVLAQRGRRDALASRLEEMIEDIQQHGCLVKDLDTGLLDFPTLLDGREVYLCWKAGETAIGFWHEVEDGFKGRQPVDADFLERHQGEPES